MFLLGSVFIADRAAGPVYYILDVEQRSGVYVVLRSALVDILELCSGVYRGSGSCLGLAACP